MRATPKPLRRLPLLLPLLLLLVAVMTGLSATAADAATARKVSLSTSASSPAVSASFTLKGKLTRSPKGSNVAIQTRNGSRWRTVATVKTSRSGAFKKSLRLSSPGAVTYRAYAAKKGRLKAATSRSLQVTARAPQVPVPAPAPVVPPAPVQPTVTTSSLEPGSVDAPYSQQLTASPAGTPGTWTATGLPAGLTTSTAGVITGTPTASGTSSVTVRFIATSSGLGSSQVLSLVVSPKVTPVITTTSLPAATVGTAYSTTLQTQGGQPGSWSVSPTLPSGLTLDSSTGTISGTPASTATTPVTVMFTHANGLTTTKSLTVTVNAAPVAPVITTTSLPVTSRGATYDVQLTASGGPGTWSASALPSGFQLSAQGRLTSTAVTAAIGTQIVTVTFTSSASGLSDADENFPVDVRRHVATTGLPVAQVNVPYSTQLRLNGSIAGTWAFLGSAPSGLSLTPQGLLTGTVSSTQNLFLQFTTADSTYADSNADFQVLPLTVEAAGTGSPAATTVSAGRDYACRVKADTTLWCWGYNFQYQLGIGQQGFADLDNATPQQVAGAGWRQVAAGDFYSTCATKTDNTLWCWGYNPEGQLGTGDSIAYSAPRQITTPNVQWASVSMGAGLACGVSNTGSLYCWGDANSIGVAVPNGGNAGQPQLVGTGWKSVEVGGYRACGIRSDDSLWCWGYGTTPAQVGSAAWSTVVVGATAACGIQTAGTLWCWGGNSSGQLGNGTTTATTTPTQVGTALWRSVSTGGRNSLDSSCGVQVDGSAWCWGDNANGQLGNGSVDGSTVPVRLDSSTAWWSVSVGDTFACGVKQDESQRCWGAGANGRLGNGFQNTSTVPVVVK